MEVGICGVFSRVGMIWFGEARGRVWFRCDFRVLQSSWWLWCLLEKYFDFLCCFGLICCLGCMVWRIGRFTGVSVMIGSKGTVAGV